MRIPIMLSVAVLSVLQMPLGIFLQNRYHNSNYFENSLVSSQLNYCYHNRIYIQMEHTFYCNCRIKSCSRCFTLSYSYRSHKPCVTWFAQQLDRFPSKFPWHKSVKRPRKNWRLRLLSIINRKSQRWMIFMLFD